VRQQPDNVTHQRNLARTYRELGALQISGIGSMTEGLQALQGARRIFADLASDRAEDVEILDDLAESHGRMSSWYHRNHAPAEELQHLEEAIKIWQKLAPREPKYERKLAAASMTLGYYHTRRGKAPDALRYFDRCQEILERRTREDPGDRDAREELHRVYTNIGFLHHLQTRRLDLAEKFLERARAEAEHLARENPSVTVYQQRWARAYEMLSDVFVSSGHRIQAERSATEAVAIYERLHAKHPDDRNISYELGETYYYLGRVMSTPARATQAEAELQKARELMQPVVDALPDDRDRPPMLARAYQSLSAVQRMLKKPDEAFASLQAAARVLEPVALDPGAPSEHQGTLVWIYLELAALHRSNGQLVPAAELAQKAYTLRKQLYLANPTSNLHPPVIVQAVFQLADLLIALKKLDEATAALQDAARLFEQAALASDRASANLRWAAQIYLRMATVERSAHRLNRAAEFAQKALELYKKLCVPGDTTQLYVPQLAGAALQLADVLREQSKPAEAEACLRQARAFCVQETPAALLAVARIDALRSTLIGAGNSQLSAEEESERSRLQDQALASLEKYVTQSYSTAPLPLKGDTYLKVLQGRAEFQKLVTDLDAKAQAQQELRKQYDRAKQLVTKGDHTAAVDAAKGVAESKQASYTMIYNAACIYAQACTAARKDATLSFADQDKLASQYGDRALELLRQAVERGYKSKANVAHMRVDTDLDSLRNREDFQKLMQELEAKGKEGGP
jgi:tetratricopeptide (TPR) repeat protein